ncbi:MAG: DUF4058 family protein [Gemmataceae bacterium]
MPMHDWTRVESGIFHDFHHEWISEIKRALNRGLLPPDCYALAEQIAAGFGPDVLTLQDRHRESEPSGGAATITLPKTKHVTEQVRGLRQRRKSRVVVRHISDDRIVAMIEIVSPGNKDSTHAFRTFVQKASELLDHRIHLLLLDPFPPGPRDPDGIHAAIWEDYTGATFELPAKEPLTFVSYESADSVRAFIETLAVGDPLPEMPLFLAPEFYIQLPLEAIYRAAWETVPARWQRVIAPEPVT